jgi:uncharacterized lipoprotein YbaY
MKSFALLLFGLTLTVGMIGCAEKKAEPTAPAATTPAAETPAAPAEEAPK